MLDEYLSQLERNGETYRVDVTTISGLHSGLCDVAHHTSDGIILKNDDFNPLVRAFYPTHAIQQVIITLDEDD
jgi:hypothetical protein